MTSFLLRFQGWWAALPRPLRLAAVLAVWGGVVLTAGADSRPLALIGFVFTVLPALAPATGSPSRGPAWDEIFARERQGTLSRIWEREALRRGLDSATLLSLPLAGPAGPGRRVVVDPAGPRAPGGGAVGRYGDSLGAYYASRAAPDGELFRAVISGGPGAGKSTIALLMTLGALRDPAATTVPLLLPLSSWDVRRQPFAQWLENAALGQLRALAHTAGEREERGFAEMLLSRRDVWLILDGADEIPRAQWPEAVRQLGRISAERQLTVLARPEFAELLARRLADRRFRKFELASPAPARVSRYLTELATAQGTLARWQPVVDELAHGTGPVAELLTVPLYLDMTWRLYGGGRDAPLPESLPATPAGLAEAARRDLGATRTALLDGFIDVAFHHPGGRLSRLGGALPARTLPGRRRAAYHTAWLAARTHPAEPGRPPAELAWWRIAALTPRPVLVGACAPVLVCGYLLGLHMPVGLTRGLAIGFSTVLTLGMLRDGGARRPPRRPWAEVLTGVAGAAGVAAAGAALIGARGGLIDAVELGCAFTAVLLLRTRLTDSSPKTVLAAVLAAPVAGTAAVSVLLWLGWQLPKGGGPLQVYGSMLVGIGLGTVTCRLLSDPATAPESSRVDLGSLPRRGRLWHCLFRGTMLSVAIGGLAGVSLTTQFGWAYGAALILVFGVCLGVPMGVLAGLLLWFGQRRPEGDSATARGSLANDRRVLAGCVLGATALATAGLAMVVHGPGARLSRHDGTLDLDLRHGALFGLAVGWILASCYTASIPVSVAHAWLALRGLLPWRIGTFLDVLHGRDVLIQLGRVYHFRHADLGRRLAQRLPEFAADDRPPDR